MGSENSLVRLQVDGSASSLLIISQSAPPAAVIAGRQDRIYMGQSYHTINPDGYRGNYYSSSRVFSDVAPRRLHGRGRCLVRP